MAAFDYRVGSSLIVVWVLSGCGSPVGPTHGRTSGYQERALPAMFQDEASDIRQSFRIRNSLRKRVELRQVQTSCTCTSAQLEDSVLRPGGETSLHLRGDWSQRRGPIRMTSVVESDAGQTWSCAVLTDIHKRIECSPEQATFGVLDPREAAERPLVISTYSRGRPPAEPSIGRTALAKAFQISVEPSRIEHLDDDIQVRKIRLVLRYRGSAEDEESGPQHGLVEVRTQDGPDSHRLEVPVYWSVQSRFIVSPSSAFFGDVGASPMSKTVTISRADKRPFRISDASSSHSAFRGEIGSPAAADAHTISVIVKPDGVERFAFGKLRVAIAESDLKVTIPVAAVRGLRKGE